MKQLYCAALLLLLLFGLTLGGSRHLRSMMADYTDRLSAARSLADRGAWDAAEALTRQVWRDWQRHDRYLHSLLRHSEVDQIHITMCEVLEALRLADPAVYNAANTKLIAQLGLLAQMEQLTVENIL